MRVTVAVLVCALASAACGQEASWTRIRHRVDVRLIDNDFVIDQEWLVTGATVAELRMGTPDLTLSGRYGVYGDRELLSTDVPEALQNDGQGANAWAHPVFAPRFLGARASTVPTPTGFHAQMAGGMLGCGASDVTFEAAGPGQVRVTEHGCYSLSKLKSGQALADIPFNIGAATFGRLPLAAAHKTMGELHNRMFNAVEPLVNMINDRRAAGHQTPLSGGQSARGR